MQYTVDGGPGDATGGGQLTEALASLAVAQDPGAVQIEGAASDVAAFEAGAAHAGAGESAPGTLLAE